MDELCMACLHADNGYCRLHAPRKPTLDEAFALACQHAEQIGLLSRIDDTTYQINFKEDEATQRRNNTTSNRNS